MEFLVLAPFILQGLAIAFDEYYFHIKRGLPLWERIGHPIDTLSVMICLFFVLLVPYSPIALKWFIGLSIFSCLMVTKDEWVHKHHCPASEQWLHAMLFLNHPVMLTCTGLIWAAGVGKASPNWVQAWLSHPEALHTMLRMQAAFSVVFFFYQVIYWNFIWKEKKADSQ